MPQWLPILLRKGCPVLFYSYIIHGYKDEYHQEILGIPKGINYHQYVDGWVVIDLTESAEFNQIFSRRIAEDGYLEYFLARCHDASDELFRHGERLRDADFNNFPTGDLLLEFMTFSSLSIHSMPFLTTIVLLQDVVEKRLRSILADSWQLDPDSEELSVKLQELMLGGEQVPLATLAVREVVRLAVSIRDHYPDLAQRLMSEGSLDESAIKISHPEVATQITGYLRQFDFLGTDYYVGEPTTVKALTSQIASVLRQQRNVPEEEPGISVSEPQLAPADEALLNTVRRLHYLRQHRIEAMFKSGRDLRGLLTEIGHRIGLSYDELLALTFMEIQESLTIGRSVVELDIVIKRMQNYGVLIENGEASIVTDEEELGRLRAQLSIEKPVGQELTGVTAYPGECRAPAQVVERLQDVSLVRAGEVLVAPMTSPYHVPAMTIAGAVVTNEGGILSHAAIVSRELRIPCVVGVSGATQVIRSGQTVHVTAKPSLGRVSISTD